MNILHIADHLGGGIGSVLRGWIEKDASNKHTILCLGNTFNSPPHPQIRENMRGRYNEINNEVLKSDVVIVHFWNHPYLFEFLTNFQFPKCQLCVWSHISGLNAPYVFSDDLVNLSDAFVFSSPISFEAEEIRGLPDTLRERLRVIWTTGNINEFLTIEKKHHDSFNVGCVGTLDYSKLHPKFVSMCSRINIPDVHFIVCGTGCDEQRIKREVSERGLDSKFTFTGVIKDIKPLLSIMDVFGYPLNPNHFGTCEQVLGEAMAAGIVPIVMKNPAEEYILYKNFFKFVSRDEDEYVFNIESFYKNQHRLTAIDEMKTRVQELYDLDTMIEKWNRVFEFAVSQPPRERKLTASSAITGSDLFVLSVGKKAGTILAGGTDTEIRNLFNSNLQWKSQSKGSVLQYLKAFPDDLLLQQWSKLL